MIEELKKIAKYRKRVKKSQNKSAALNFLKMFRDLSKPNKPDEYYYNIYCGKLEYFNTDKLEIILKNDFKLSDYMIDKLLKDINFEDCVDIYDWAKYNAHISLLKSLIFHDLLFGKNLNDVINEAIPYDNIFLIKAILKSGIDINKPDSKGKFSLILACNYEISNVNINTIKLLIKSGADINIIEDNFWTPINMTLFNVSYFEKGDTEIKTCEKIFELLIKSVAKITNITKRDDYNLLFDAVLYRNVKIIKLLINAGINISKVKFVKYPYMDNDLSEFIWGSVDEEERSIDNLDVKILKLLISKLNLKEKDGCGNTILESIIKNKYIEKNIKNKLIKIVKSK